MMKLTSESDVDSEHTYLPFVLGVLGNFSGNSSRLTKPFSNRLFIEVDRYNFETVMARIKPGLQFTVENRLNSIQEESEFKVSLEFLTMDDFSQENVAHQVPQLAHLLDQRPNRDDPIKAAKNSERSRPEIDRVISDQLHEILHHERLQRLEASWRGLHYLVHQAQSDANLRIRVLNVSKSELTCDMNKHLEIESSVLFDKVNRAGYGKLDGPPASCLIGDYEFGCEIEDLDLLKHISAIAACAFTPFISAAGPELFGQDSFADIFKNHSLAKIFENPTYTEWRSFRNSEESRYVALTLPRMLMRRPYRPEDSIEGENDLNFVEYFGDTESLLWGNVAYAVGARIANLVSKFGWPLRMDLKKDDRVVGLATFEFPAETGRRTTIGPAEVSIDDDTENELGKLGFIPLRNHPDSKCAAFSTSYTCQQPKMHSASEAAEGAALLSRLCVVLFCARFAQGVKCICRQIPRESLQSAEEVERRLNNWIAQYVHADGARLPRTEELVAYPLKECMVSVAKHSDTCDQLVATIFLRPGTPMGDHLWPTFKTVVRIADHALKPS